MADVDFVVTYLDSTDPAWLKARAEYKPDAANESINPASRYRNMDNFRYWLRSVEAYAPWVHRIHVVTFGHVPDWLDASNPKINVVKHADFIPSQYLPTFSSRVIELCLDRIDGLAETFVNFNDDFFLNSPTRQSDFFVKGLPVLQLMHTPILPSEEFNVVLYNNALALNQMVDASKRLITTRMFSPRNGAFAVAANLLMTPVLLYMKKFVGFRPDHLSQALTKTAYAKVKALIPDQYELALSNRFRNRDTINAWIMLDYLRATGDFWPHNSFRFGKMIPMGQKVDYEALLRSNYKVICFNDTEDIDFEQERDRLNQALASKFPKASGFEKG